VKVVDVEGEVTYGVALNAEGEESVWQSHAIL